MQLRRNSGVAYWAKQEEPTKEANGGFDWLAYHFYRVNYREEWEAEKKKQRNAI